MQIKAQYPVKTVAISDIKIGKRLRPVNPDKVAELQDSIRVVGLLQPVVVADVDGEFKLIAGRHRLAAVKANKGETIQAQVRSDVTADDLRLIEIEENVTRYSLSAAELAAQLSMRQEIIEKRTEAALQGDAPAKKSKTKVKAGSVRDLAKKAGLGKDKVAKALKRARDLGTDVVADLTGTSMDKGEELDALVKVKEADPKKAAEIVADAKAGKKVSARASLPKAAVDAIHGDKGRARAACIKFRRVLKEYSDLNIFGDLEPIIAKIEEELNRD